MLSNMACSLIRHKRIYTTVPKAKELRKYVEPLITKSKEDTTHSRRTVFKYLNNKYAVTELFIDIAPKIGDRPGGYTRILKTGFRLGDNAAMCFIELVDYNDNMLKPAKGAVKQKTRRSRSKKKSEDVVAATPTQTKEVKTEEVTTVAPEEVTAAPAPKPKKAPKAKAAEKTETPVTADETKPEEIAAPEVATEPAIETAPEAAIEAVQETAPEVAPEVASEPSPSEATDTTDNA
jgi:large subunit ribosomal protein L17